MRLCREAGVRVSADESLNTLSDAMALVRHEACDVMNIKVPKVGGLLLSKRMAAIAAAAGMPVVVGGRTTLEVCRAASRHFAASTPVTAGLAHEGPGPASQALSDDVVRERTTWATVKAGGGRGVGVEQSPGLGVEILWEKVSRYAVPA
jgi:muconate cycloisomerase